VKIEYKKRLVAFIDVLGFKNLVFAADLAPIEKYYSFLLSKFADGAIKRRLEYLLVSDSIVIFCDDTKENLTTLIKFAGLLQSGLLTEGIIVRGAISRGELFVDQEKNIIVGAGLVHSYALEAAAKYPRVIVDRKVIEHHFGSTTNAIKMTYTGSRPNLSIQSHNGGMSDYVYVHYGRILANGVSAKPYEAVLEIFKKEFYKNEHIDKFEWLRKYLKSALTESVEYLAAKNEPTRNERAKLKHNRRAVEALSNL
jgi:hypothetical protein